MGYIRRSLRVTIRLVGRKPLLSLCGEFPGVLPFGTLRTAYAQEID